MMIRYPFCIIYTGVAILVCETETGFTSRITLYYFATVIVCPAFLALIFSRKCIIVCVWNDLDAIQNTRISQNTINTIIRSSTSMTLGMAWYFTSIPSPLYLTFTYSFYSLRISITRTALVVIRSYAAIAFRMTIG